MNLGDRMNKKLRIIMIGAHPDDCDFFRWGYCDKIYKDGA